MPCDAISWPASAISRTISGCLRSTPAEHEEDSLNAREDRSSGARSEATPPSRPTGLTAAAVGSTWASLSWSASTDNLGVTAYIVRRNGTQVATPATTSYGDTGLSPATTYSYTVAAEDVAGNVSPN